jgi:nicotinamide mononucleotide transporter
MHEEVKLLLQQIIKTDWIQWAAVILGVAEVLLAKANKIWLYPSGIASILLSIYILFGAGLYAECLLNGYYLVMSIYGWWYWKKKKDRPVVAITSCNSKDWRIVYVIAIGGFIILFLALKYFTPSNVPVWDAFVSATAWAGMWLLAKRKIENWILLNISNFFAIPLLLYKGLPLYAMLTIFLFIIAIQGYIKWNKIMKNNKEQLQYPAIS